MPFNINTFKSAMKFGGSRASLFEVKLTNPINGAGDQKLTWTCRAASIPSRNVNQLPIPYFGRNIKVAGVVQNYEDWEVTIINDEDYLVRNALEEWSHTINSPIGNVRRLPSSDQSLYKSTADVTQYSQNGTKLREYKFSGLFPVAVAPMQLDWGQDEIMSYGVTFSVDYWTVGESSTTGYAGGINI